MKSLITLALFALSQCALAQGEAQMREFLKLPWVQGPNTLQLSDKAVLTYDKNLLAIGPDNANRALELLGNLPSKEIRYIFGKSDFSWFAVIKFSPSGYIKDDEKIDPDALLEALKEQNISANDERRKLGLDSLELVGWAVPPHYNKQTNRLEWGTKLREGNAQGFTVNYTSRLLGRTGYFSSMLVTSEQELEAHLIEYNSALTKFSFNAGEKYSEFKPGDKVAEYGLAALVVGGAAAAAVKSKGFWKLVGLGILGALAALWAAFKRFVSRKR